MTSIESGGVLPFVQPITPDIFFSRQPHSQRFKELYKDIKKQIAELLLTYECFRDDEKEKDANGSGLGKDRHKGHGHGHGTNIRHQRHHNNLAEPLPSSIKKVSCYKERVARDICSNLNKLNKSNFKSILDKIMRMTSQANVDQITLLILSKAIHEDVYTELYIEILWTIVKKFHSQKGKIQEFYDMFQESIDKLLVLISKLDYNNYSDFCQFGLLKEEIMNRQRILFLLIDNGFPLQTQSSFFKNYYLYLLENLVVFSNTNNQHMTGAILAIFDMFIKNIYTNDNHCVKSWNTLERDAVSAMLECKKSINCKKIEFHIENLLGYINRVRNDRLQISDSQRVEETPEQ